MIGHHSHTHDYLIDETNDQFISDIETAKKSFLIILDIYQQYFRILLVNIQNL